MRRGCRPSQWMSATHVIQVGCCCNGNGNRKSSGSSSGNGTGNGSRTTKKQQPQRQQPQHWQARRQRQQQEQWQPRTLQNSLSSASLTSSSAVVTDSDRPDRAARRKPVVCLLISVRCSLFRVQVMVSEYTLLCDWLTCAPMSEFWQAVWLAWLLRLTLIDCQVVWWVNFDWQLLLSDWLSGCLSDEWLSEWLTCALVSDWQPILTLQLIDRCSDKWLAGCDWLSEVMTGSYYPVKFRGKRGELNRLTEKNIKSESEGSSRINSGKLW